MFEKSITLKEVKSFAKKHGYLVAVYKKKYDNYILKEYHAFNTDKEIKIKIKNIEDVLNLKEFTSKNEGYCFKLHVNFKVPPAIPILSEVS